MIEKNKFLKEKFLSHGVVENKSEKAFNRVEDGWRPKNNLAELRLLIRELVWEKSDEYRSRTNSKISDYAVIEMCCRIPQDTIKKAINGRYNASRNFLAKFCVGLKLGIEKSNELFRIHSGELSLTNDFDYIIYHALKTKDDIDYFIEEVHEYIGINLDRDRA